MHPTHVDMTLLIIGIVRPLAYLVAILFWIRNGRLLCTAAFIGAVFNSSVVALANAHVDVSLALLNFVAFSSTPSAALIVLGPIASYTTNVRVGGRWLF